MTSGYWFLASLGQRVCRKGPGGGVILNGRSIGINLEFGIMWAVAKQAWTLEPRSNLGPLACLKSVGVDPDLSSLVLK